MGAFSTEGGVGSWVVAFEPAQLSGSGVHDNAISCLANVLKMMEIRDGNWRMADGRWQMADGK